jgi:Potential Queuosine, Q, salvage protein family
MFVPSPLSLSSAKPIIPGWRMTAEQVQSTRHYVTISVDDIPEILPWLAPGPANEAWRGYVSVVDLAAPDTSRLFFELALTISQFGGFVGYRSDGEIDTWKRDGSGVKAILATMSEIRAARKLPGIDIQDDYDRELAHFFIRVPFGKQRLDMLTEVGTPMARRYFHHLLATAKGRDGSYRFNVLHMTGLACRFPLSFGEDPVFYKKASLLLMTMEIALNQLGAKAVAETLPPADYRIPQILEGLDILKFSDEVSRKVKDGHVFRLADPEVHAIRAATVEAVGLIKARYEQQHGRETTCAEIDGLLYLLSRNRPLMSRTTMKPHMLVATAAF